MRSVEPAARRRAAGWLLPALSGVLLVVAAVYLRFGATPLIDRRARRWAAEHHDALAFTVLNVGKDVGYLLYVAPVLVLVAAIMSVLQHDAWPLVRTGIAVAAVALVTSVLKVLVARPGPSGVGPPAVDGAWPSGHSVTAVTAVLLLVGFLPPALRAHPAVITAAVLVPVVVGIGLVYCGHHWLTDVLAGAPLGYVVVRIATALTTSAAVPAPSASSILARTSVAGR